MIRIGIVAIILGGVLGYYTFNEARLATQASGAPEEITLKKLIARGPDGNANIILTDYFLCVNYVRQEDRPGNWTHLWIAVVPLDEVDPNQKDPPRPAAPKALIYSTNVRNEQELEAKLDKKKLPAMVTNRIASVESKIQDLLKKDYPQINFDTCLIIEESRTPSGGIMLFVMGGGAVLCVLVGLGLVGIGWSGEKAA